MRILFIGDIVGRPGRKTLSILLPQLKKEFAKIDFIIVNGENAAAGKGLTEKIMNDLFDMGVDGITSGNHIWDRSDFYSVLDEEIRVVRPANYPPGCPGQGVSVLSKNGKRLALLNLQGRVFMPDLDCPFRKADEILEELNGVPVLVDFHAEATSEKRVLGFYLDGRVSAFLGTHTHVQTADEEILPDGTAYISDVGKTGAHRSAIGMTLESVLPRFLTALPSRFQVAEDDLRLCAVLIDVEEETGKALSIQRIMRFLPKED